MVKLYAISVFYKAPNKGRLLKSAYDLETVSFFQRGPVQKFMRFASKTLIESTQAASRQSVEQDVYMCHVYVRADNLGAVLISDHEYPHRVAHTLVTTVLDDFSAKIGNDQWPSGSESSINFTTLPATLRYYNYPREVDALAKLQKDLDETKIIVWKTREAVLERGENLDDLLSRAEKLVQSQVFHKMRKKKTNSCCNFW